LLVASPMSKTHGLPKQKCTQIGMSSKLKRYNIPNAVYFITTKTLDNKPLFHDDKAAAIFTDTLYYCRQRYVFLLAAFVLMPDHLHALIMPKNGHTISAVMQKIKSLVAKRLREETGQSGNIWQKSFYDFIVISQERLLEKIQYIYNNPVRKGLANTIKEFSYSSANKKYENDLQRILG